MRPAPPHAAVPTPLGGLLLGRMGVGVMLSLAIAFCALEDAEQLPWAVQAMMAVVKSIEPMSLASPNSRHTAILFATLWAISPAVLVLVFRERDSYFPPRDWPGKITTTLISLALAAALVAFMVFGYGNDPTAWGDLDSRRSLRRFLLGSRLNTGAFGGLLVFFTAYAATAAAVLLGRTFTRQKR